MAKLLMISFDAVGSHKLESLLERPVFKSLYEKASVASDVKSIFITNTYPVHASIATGVLPCDHGLISNTEPYPKSHPKWCYEAKQLKSKTLWQAAREKGLKTAAVMWPVTAGAKEINYNIPEIAKQPGESQLALNLRYGTKLLSLRLFMKYRHLLKGTVQPYLDGFTTASMADILKRKRPDLALVHLTAFDSFCHIYGTTAKELETAMDSLCENLEKLLKAAGDQYHVIVFSDHSQIDCSHAMLPNEGLDGRMGFFECCGGCGFFHPNRASLEETEKIKADQMAAPGFFRLLTKEEMTECGRGELPFGMAAKPGWVYEGVLSDEKANHGYPVDYENYSVFYLVRGQGYASGAHYYGGSLLDITPIAQNILELDMPGLFRKSPI